MGTRAHAKPTIDMVCIRAVPYRTVPARSVESECTSLHTQRQADMQDQNSKQIWGSVATLQYMHVPSHFFCGFGSDAHPGTKISFPLTHPIQTPEMQVYMRHALSPQNVPRQHAYTSSAKTNLAYIVAAVVVAHAEVDHETAAPVRGRAAHADGAARLIFGVWRGRQAAGA